MKRARNLLELHRRLRPHRLVVVNTTAVQPALLLLDLHVLPVELLLKAVEALPLRRRRWG